MGLAALAPAVASAIVRLPLTSASKKLRNCGLRAKLNDDEDDPLLQAAINRASLRLQETRRPDPLFLDQYAGCFVPDNIPMDMGRYLRHYCLATKFVDDKLLMTMNDRDRLRQVVLLTDGMDTRPYRLGWPNSTLIFDVSPERVFRKAAKKLEDVGAKIQKGCLFLRVPLESSDIQQILCNKGFNGNRPSIWALQGLPLMTLGSFEVILSIVSNLAMKGCLFLGELPAWETEAEAGIKSSTQARMEKIFMGNGFRVELNSYSEVAAKLGRELAPQDYKGLLFVAEQLRFSDDQMENWRREFQRIEEEGDEEGFEEL
ncbi:O-methyltransferase 1, chloroplastic [Rhododendron vialii]|uniref:O-methyltransferase 1, chloroplastic n=1 Tax=Rhododendron vialii TaxID=182163 RepID=UPI00265DFFA3|nr:O-methyltransferase 1, chloroplastic [Rhododendron vialii]